MHRLAPLLLTLLLVTGMPAVLAAQSLRGGAIRGVVRGPSGPLEGAAVALIGTERAVFTLPDGEFVIDRLSPGEYDLLVEAIGYRPVLLTGVPIAPDREVAVAVDTHLLQSSTISVDSVAFGGYVADSEFSIASTILGRNWRFMAGYPQALAGLVNRLGFADQISIDGLPLGNGSMVVDGIPLPLDFDGSIDDGLILPFPSLALETASLSTGQTVSGIAGHNGTSWVLTTRAAPQVPTLESTLSAGALVLDDTSRPALTGQLLVGGPLSQAVSGFLAADFGTDEKSATPAEFSSVARSAVSDLARNNSDLDLQGSGALRRPSTYLSSAVGLDWTGRRDAIRVRGQLGSRRMLEHQSSEGWYSGDAPPSLSTAGVWGAWEVGGDSWANTFRLGADFYRRDPRERRGLEGNDGLQTSTQVLGLGMSVGAPAEERLFERVRFTLAESIRLAWGDHDLQLAGIASLNRYTIQPQNAAEFLFGGGGGVTQLSGGFKEVSSQASASGFTTSLLSASITDGWNASENVELEFGVTGEAEIHRPQTAEVSAEWVEQTGHTVVGVSELQLRVMPRARLTLSQTGWRLTASAGVFSEPLDPGLLDEVLRETGLTRVRRSFGDLAGWPLAPDTIALPFTGTKLAIADASLASPRSLRASLAFQRTLPFNARFSASADFRWTDRLPTRSDLNRSVSPVGVDQYGRPLFGALVKSSSLVAAEPGSNRRFTDFDIVDLIRADGESRYVGLTFQLVGTVAQTIDFSAAYTRSHSRDNWPDGGWSGSRSAAPYYPDLQDGGDWVRGTSDYDVPSRLNVSAEASSVAGMPIRIGASYRLQSSRPFTPGFQEGVDANGDYIAGNDPAFLDRSLPGYAELADDWDCLREGTGYARRNSCRLGSTSALDLRVGVSLRSSSEIYLDVADLFATPDVLPDRALYLIDADSVLSVGPSGVTNVPLVVNSNFGKPLLSRARPVQIRLGLHLTF